MPMPEARNSTWVSNTGGSNPCMGPSSLLLSHVHWQGTGPEAEQSVLKLELQYGMSTLHTAVSHCYLCLFTLVCSYFPYTFSSHSPVNSHTYLLSLPSSMAMPVAGPLTCNVLCCIACVWQRAWQLIKIPTYMSSKCFSFIHLFLSNWHVLKIWLQFSRLVLGSRYVTVWLRHSVTSHTCARLSVCDSKKIWVS